MASQAKLLILVHPIMLILQLISLGKIQETKFPLKQILSN